MKGSCEKYVRGYNESELDVDEDNVCKQSRREGNIHTNVRIYSYSIEVHLSYSFSLE